MEPYKKGDDEEMQILYEDPPPLTPAQPESARGSRASSGKGSARPFIPIPGYTPIPSPAENLVEDEAEVYAPGSTRNSVNEEPANTPVAVVGSARNSAQDHANTSSPGSARNSVQGAGRNSAQGSTRNSVNEEPANTPVAVAGSARNSVQEPANISAPGSARNSVQGAGRNSAQGSARNSVNEEPANTPVAVAGSARNSVQEPANISAPGSARNSVQEAGKNSVPGSARNSVNEEPANTPVAVAGSARNSVQEPANISAPGSARNSVQEAGKNSVPGSARNSVNEEPAMTPVVGAGSARNSTEEPANTSAPGSARNSVQEAGRNSAQGSARNSVTGDPANISAPGSLRNSLQGEPVNTSANCSARNSVPGSTKAAEEGIPEVTAERCSKANATEPCASARQEAVVQGQSNRYSVSTEVCDAGYCPATTSITFGETEKEQLKAVGQHLLQIGKELLAEMNFVEGLLEKFGSLVFEKPVDVQAEEESSKQDEKPDEPEPVKNTCHRFESDDVPKGASMTAEEVDTLKAQLVDAIAVQAKKLSWVHEKTEEYNQMAQSAFYGSGFATPQRPSITNNYEMQVTQAVQADIRKNVALVEMKMDKLEDRMQLCERQIPEVYNTLHSIITKTVEEMSVLRQGVTQARAISENVKVSYEEKLEHLEKQILKLAQIVWELKCETRVQMHFGREF